MAIVAIPVTAWVVLEQAESYAAVAFEPSIPAPSVQTVQAMPALEVGTHLAELLSACIQILAMGAQRDIQYR